MLQPLFGGHLFRIAIECDPKDVLNDGVLWMARPIHSSSFHSSQEANMTGSSRIFLLGLFILAPLRPAAAQSADIFSFNGKKTGINPLAGLIEGADGIYYGTTSKRAAHNGAVYSFTLGRNNSAKAQLLYKFQGGVDGSTPMGNLVLDSSGALYGTTKKGGAQNQGTAFKLTPPVKGGKTWTETILYAFSGGADGGNPVAGLLLGSGGGLYGTTLFGGSGKGDRGAGTVFMLTPPAMGNTAWKETVLHTFDTVDGAWPAAALIADANGALYGTTIQGGTDRQGTVFEVSPPAKGHMKWIETVLYDVGGTANSLQSGLTFDQNGNLYGTLQSSCELGCGAVFELTPPADGQTSWTETTLYTFPTDYPNDIYLDSAVTLGPDGALYGVTTGSGSYACGLAFKLTSPSGGQGAWAETTLYDFDVDAGADGGCAPEAPLLLTSGGELLGTAVRGGSRNGGTIFELSP